MDKSLSDALTAWRRHLHANPELTLYETNTAAFVCARLAELGVPFVAGIGGHGVVATISRGQSNRSVGLRADMDALPIAETTGLAYASGNPGVMHACGHDGHTTSLLGAAALLQQDTSWTGTVQLVFQPAEEGGGGAKSMIADGLFDRFPMERILPSRIRMSVTVSMLRAGSTTRPFLTSRFTSSGLPASKRELPCGRRRRQKPDRGSLKTDRRLRPLQFPRLDSWARDA